jgi:DNA gyrase subunit A
LLNLAEGETIADCRAVRDFDEPGQYLLMATRNGLVKKTELKAYRRPMKRGIIAIKLREGDELVDVVVARDGEELLLATASGMAIRFAQDDLRALGRNSSGVKGVTLTGDDQLVGMVVADPEASLLTVCENGYGKRTLFGPNKSDAGADSGAEAGTDASTDDELTSGNHYRTQGRGGKGLRDIKASSRNGPVVSIVRVTDEDEVLMMTARGKIQRVRTAEISQIGRNTQGVRIMGLAKGDSVAAVVRVPLEENGDSAAPTSSS